MKKQSLLVVLLLTFVGTGIFGCNDDSDNSNVIREDTSRNGSTINETDDAFGLSIKKIDQATVDNFIKMLEQEFGGTFSAVKNPNDSATPGWVIVKNHTTGKKVAFEMLNYLPGDSWEEYFESSFANNPVTITSEQYDPLDDEMNYYGKSYDFDGYYLGEFMFEETDLSSKDLEKMMALNEAYNNSKIAEGLVANYGLSEEKSNDMVEMAMAWKKVSRTRSMTKSDTSAFIREFTGGSDLASINDAISKYVEEGDSSSVDDIVDCASDYYEVSPEQVRELINGALGTDL